MGTTSFELFFCNASGDLYQLIHLNRAIDRKETTITFKTYIIQIIFFEEVARHPALIPRVYICIFSINVDPYIRLTEHIAGIFR